MFILEEDACKQNHYLCHWHHPWHSKQTLDQNPYEPKDYHQVDLRWSYGKQGCRKPGFHCDNWTFYFNILYSAYTACLELSSFGFWSASKKPTLDPLSLQDSLGINLLGSWALWDSSSAKLVPNATHRKQALPLRSEKHRLI